ncbi:hypothetical protein DFH06DRAFT_1130836 [Mycena polygramma]|nr:hypothetical protein DFH06DRAFT_1130836 [Mycena polygramma]
MWCLVVPPFVAWPADAARCAQMRLMIEARRSSARCSGMPGLKIESQTVAAFQESATGLQGDIPAIKMRAVMAESAVSGTTFPVDQTQDTTACCDNFRNLQLWGYATWAKQLRPVRHVEKRADTTSILLYHPWGNISGVQLVSSNMFSLTPTPMPTHLGSAISDEERRNRYCFSSVGVKEP